MLYVEFAVLIIAVSCVLQYEVQQTMSATMTVTAVRSEVGRTRHRPRSELESEDGT